MACRGGLIVLYSFENNSLGIAPLVSESEYSQGMDVFKWLSSIEIIEGMGMTKSELIERIAEQQDQLSLKDVELAVKLMLEHMSQILAAGERIEIRGFGSFSLHYRAPRVGRNPKTGDSVELTGKYVPHFKPGKEMRDRVNESIGG